MRTIFLSILLLVSMSLCHAQIAPPKQTDTLIISSVKYNYADINHDNWPCTVIYKSTQDIQIGNQTFNIVRAERLAHLQSSVFKLSKDLIDSIHEEGIVAYTS